MSEKEKRKKAKRAAKKAAKKEAKKAAKNRPPPPPQHPRALPDLMIYASGHNILRVTHGMGFPPEGMIARH